MSLIIKRGQINIGIIVIVFFCCGKLFSQGITYSDLSSQENVLKNTLLNSENFFKGGGEDLPYFQRKDGNLYIKYYKSLGTTVIFEFKDKHEFLGLINDIKKRANFRFKFNTDYSSPIVYNFVTSGGNKIRFNYSESKISVEFSSKTSSFLEKNSDLLTVFVCLSTDAYAYHTNLKCEGLGNCDTDFAKSNMGEAKKYGYSICEICTDPY